MTVNYGIRIEIQDLLLEPFQVRIQLQSRVTRSETRDEDVCPSVLYRVVLVLLVADFENLLGTGSDVGDFERGVVDQGVEMGWCRDGLCRCLTQVLAEFPPEGIQHKFRCCLPSGVLLDLLGVQDDSLASMVPASIHPFLILRLGPPGISTGFRLQFQPGVHVVPEQLTASLTFGKVPHLMDGQNPVTLLNCFLYFGRAPRTVEGALRVGVRASGRSFK